MRAARLLRLRPSRGPFHPTARRVTRPAASPDDALRATAAGVPGAAAEALADALLFECGALSVSVDEDRGGGEDEAPIFKDALQATPSTSSRVWPRCRVTAVFPAAGGEAAVKSATSAAAAAAGVDATWSLETAHAAEWQAALRGAFEPVCAGDGVWVVPTGEAVPAAARGRGSLVVRVTPGLAFGTGAHPTTAMCLAWLARERESVASGPLLDFGCGSGVLAAAGALLGAPAVLATDVEEQAVTATDATAAANGVTVRACLVPADPFAPPPPELAAVAGTCTIVVANILAGPLAALAPTLAAAAAPGAPVGLSGVLSLQAPELIAAYASSGIRLAIEDEREGWVLLAGRRE